MGQARRFGQGHVHHHQQLQLLEGGAVGLGVGVGEHGVGAVDPHGPHPVGAGVGDFVGQNVGRVQAANREHAVVGRADAFFPLVGIAHQRNEQGVQVVAAGPAKIARQQVEELFEVAVQGGVLRMLGTQIDPHAGFFGGGETAGHALDIGQRHVAALGMRFEVEGQQLLLHRLETGAVPGQKRLVVQLLTHDNGQHRQQQISVGAGAKLEVNIGHFRRFRHLRVDDDHGAGGVFLDNLEGVAGIHNAVRLKRVGTDEQHVVGVLYVFGGVAKLAAKQAAVHPDVAGFFLGQGRVDEPAAHGGQHLAAVHAAPVVALPAAAHEGKRRPAVLPFHLVELLRDFTQRGVPADAGKRAIGLALKRVAQAVVVVLVIFEPGRFLADVALADGVLLIAPDFGKFPVLNVGLQAAVTGTQRAGGYGQGHGFFKE